MIVGVYVCVAGAAISWFTALFSGIDLIANHRRPDRPVTWYFVSGMAGLDPDNFAP
jgi:hypothetical protein